MGFWSGFEGLTGHRPGAFKGFKLKDIIDDDLWKRKQRTWSGQMDPTGPGDLRFSRGGEPMMTNWYNGRGAVAPLNANERSVSDLMRNQGMQAVQESPKVGELPSYAEQFANMYPDRYPPDVVSAARPWPNIQAQMLSDPLQGVGSMRIPPAELMGTQVPQVQTNRRPFQMSDMTIPPAELMGDKKTVREIFADPTKSDKVTETITQKVPMGDMRIPTSELMGGGQRVPTGSAQWGNVQHPPNWQQRFSPVSIMNMRIPTSELVGGRDEDRIREMMRVLEGMRARRGY